MIEQFAIARSHLESELFDLNHASNMTIRASLLISKFAQSARNIGKANFEIGTLA